MQLAPFQRDVQVRFKANQACSTAAHGGLIGDSGGGVVPLRDGQRDVGLTHGFFGALQARFDAGDADAGGYVEAMLAQLEKAGVAVDRVNLVGSSTDMTSTLLSRVDSRTRCVLLSHITSPWAEVLPVELIHDALRDTDVELVNCFVHGNGSADFAPLHFTSTSVTGSARVVHTTVVDNLSGADDANGVFCGGAYQVTVRNDIIHGNQGPEPPVAGCAVTYSLLGPEIAPGIGNVLGTPRFIDREAGDLHLVPDSVGVDDGTSGDADIDVDGDPRPSGSGPDMGADEVTRGTAARVSPAG